MGRTRWPFISSDCRFSNVYILSAAHRFATRAFQYGAAVWGFRARALASGHATDARRSSSMHISYGSTVSKCSQISCSLSVAITVSLRPSSVSRQVDRPVSLLARVIWSAERRLAVSASTCPVRGHTRYRRCISIRLIVEPSVPALTPYRRLTRQIRRGHRIDRV